MSKPRWWLQFIGHRWIGGLRLERVDIRNAVDLVSVVQFADFCTKLCQLPPDSLILPFGSIHIEEANNNRGESRRCKKTQTFQPFGRQAEYLSNKSRPEVPAYRTYWLARLSQII